MIAEKELQLGRRSRHPASTIVWPPLWSATRKQVATPEIPTPGPPIPVEPEPPWMPTPTPWRKQLARMPIPDRQRWGDLSNALADQGAPWPEDERRAFVDLFPELELPE